MIISYKKNFSLTQSKMRLSPFLYYMKIYIENDQEKKSMKPPSASRAAVRPG